MSGSVWGWPSTRATMLALKAIFRAVCLKRLLSTLRGAASFLHSMTMRMPSRSDSSRRSAMPSILPVLTSSAIFSSRAGLVDLVGDGRGHDGGAAAARLLEGHLGLHDDATATMGVHVADGVDLLPLAGHRVAAPVVAEDHAAGGQVRAQQVLAELRGGEVGVVDEGLRGAHDLAEVVGRDVRGHAHGDAGRAVDEQVGQPGRQDGRLHARAVVVLDEVDRVLVDVGQDLGRDGASCAPRCSAWRPAGRRRPSRSCPGRRRAGSAARSPGPGARGRRRWPGRRAGGTCP